MSTTPQQQAVLDTIRDRRQNVAVDAVAGAGKTTTIVKACALAGPQAGFLAFNKHIAAELKDRLGGTAEASTLHGLGFRILAQKARGELNLLYVALTRARRELYLVDDTIRRTDTAADWVEKVADGFPRWELTNKSTTTEKMT